MADQFNPMNGDDIISQLMAEFNIKGVPQARSNYSLGSQNNMLGSTWGAGGNLGGMGGVAQPTQFMGATNYGLGGIASAGGSGLGQGLNAGSGTLGGIGGYSPNPGAAGEAAGTSWSDKLFGYTDTNTGIKTNGMAGYGLALGSGLMNGYMGMKGIDIAEKTLAANKDQFDKNYAAQLGTTRGTITDRNGRRNQELAALGRSTKSDQEALAQYGVA